jgi:surfeit locus 1 family protein
MSPRIRFTSSWKISIVGILLALGMVRLSYWQWERHQQKKAQIAMLDSRLALEPVPLLPLIEDPSVQWDELIHRRVKFAGEFDFRHEVLLRNRRYRGLAGTFVLTPLKIKDSPYYILVSRGFIPLGASTPEKRRQFWIPRETEFTGLIKNGDIRKFLAPADPPSGPGQTWVDAWLRVDLPAISRQLPYPLLPIWVELMDNRSLEEVKAAIVTSSEGREELLSLATRAVMQEREVPTDMFPVPVYDIMIPPGRHLGYVFEWALMALGTLVATFILQLRRVQGRTNQKTAG